MAIKGLCCIANMLVCCIVHIYMKPDLNFTVIIRSCFAVIFVKPDTGKCSGWCINLAWPLCISPTPTAGDVAQPWTLAGHSCPLYPSQGGAVSEPAYAPQMGYVCGKHNVWCREPAHDILWEAQAIAPTSRRHPADPSFSTDVHQCCWRSSPATDLLPGISFGKLYYLHVHYTCTDFQNGLLECIYLLWMKLSRFMTHHGI
jgi:hypothetical protein